MTQGVAATNLVFPPLMWGEATDDDAMARATVRAIEGCDAGLVCYHLAPIAMQAAFVFAPEIPLTQAMVMLPLCGVGFQNALGALAPPEVSVHLAWTGDIILNGARCGRLRARASSTDPEAVPDWLVVGFELPLFPPDDEPGKTPDETTLFAEGCAEVEPPMLVEAWARHTLNWISRWESDGSRALHTEWQGLAHGVGGETRYGDMRGTFIGVDEDFGMLLRADDQTTLIPLTQILEDCP